MSYHFNLCGTCTYIQSVFISFQCGKTSFRVTSTLALALYTGVQMCSEGEGVGGPMVPVTLLGSEKMY